MGDNTFSLTVGNTRDGFLVYYNDMLMSTKHKGVGYGTLSVASIAVEYNGTADFKAENNVFYASVMLYINSC